MLGVFQLFLQTINIYNKPLQDITSRNYEIKSQSSMKESQSNDKISQNCEIRKNLEQKVVQKDELILEVKKKSLKFLLKSQYFQIKVIILEYYGFRL